MSVEDPAPDLTMRRAHRADLDAVGRLHLRSREHAAPAMPPAAHDAGAVLAHVGAWDLDEREVWLAEDAAGALVGYAALAGDWLEDLYVDPGAQRSGVGTALLEVVRSLRPDGFCLWVFETNAPARAFYAAAGLVELERTDGSANAERRPDLRLAWAGRDPLGFLRGLIDDVDAELGDLLARRAALSAAVQSVKPSTRRDPVREQAVARAVAARVPALDPRDVEQIMDAVIGAALAASRG